MKENLRLLRPLFRGFPIVLLFMTLAVLAARKYLSYVTPMYESTSKLKLADIHEGVYNSNLFKDLDVFVASNKIMAEIEVLKSNLLISKALDSLDFETEVYRKGKLRSAELYHESPFLVQSQIQPDSLFEKKIAVEVTDGQQFRIQWPGKGWVNARFGEPLSLPGALVLLSRNEELLRQRPGLPIRDQYELVFRDRTKLVESIAKDLDITSVDKDVAILRINYKSAVPEKAAALVNQLARTYIQDFIETKYRTAETTVRFLDDQLKAVSGQLAASEQEIVQYRDDRNIVNLRQETETDLRQISQLRIQQTNIKMSLKAIEELDAYIKNGQDRFFELAPNFEAFTDLLSTEIIKSIQRLEAEKKDLLLQYTPEEERVQVIDRKMADLKKYLTESIGNTRKNLEVKDQKLNEDIVNAERAFIGIPEKERMLTALNRDFDLYQKSYNFLTEKKMEAEIAQAARIAFHRIISFAEIARTPVSPNRSIITIVAGILGMLISIAGIYTVHAAKAKVNDAWNVEKNSATPIALQTPFLKTPAQVSRHFLKAAVQMELKGLVGNGRLLVVSSFTDKEGRSFHARGLAQAFFKQGRKVLLIKIGENPSSSTVGYDVKCIDPLDLQVFSRDRLAQFLGGLQQQYDLIVVDNEALQEETVGLLLMGAADQNLVVFDVRRTPLSVISRTDLLVDEFQLPGLGFILNRDGYNPNIVSECWTLIRKALSFKARRHA